MKILNNNNHVPRLNILGVEISMTDMTNTLYVIENCIDHNKHAYVCVRDVHGIICSQKDIVLRNIHNKSILTVPDGMPLVWIARFNNYKNIKKIYGPDLMDILCKRSVIKGYTHFLYGGNEGIANQLKINLEKKYPGIKISGTYTPLFNKKYKKESQDVINMINNHKPNILWIGLSTPKQEYFMGDWHNKVSANVMIGVGAAFDIHSDNIKDAPEWIKNSGFQWLFRVYKEPKRLLLRYLYSIPIFIIKYGKQLIKEKKFKKIK